MSLGGSSNCSICEGPLCLCGNLFLNGGFESLFFSSYIHMLPDPKLKPIDAIIEGFQSEHLVGSSCSTSDGSPAGNLSNESTSESPTNKFEGLSGKALKVAIRKEKNRIAAKESRDRSKRELDGLRSKVQYLEGRVEELVAENKHLKSIIEDNGLKVESRIAKRQRR